MRAADTTRSKANWSRFGTPLERFWNENEVFMDFFGVTTDPTQKRALVPFQIRWMLLHADYTSM